MNPYEDYFLQNGHGLKVYIGSPHQRGHGIGSFLGGLFRSVLPLLKSGARAIGHEALRTGANIATDIVTHNKPFKYAFENRLLESSNALKNKAQEKINKLMEGSGYNSLKTRKRSHSSTSRRRKNVKKRKTAKPKKSKRRNRNKKNKSQKRTVLDIFTK